MKYLIIPILILFSNVATADWAKVFSCIANQGSGYIYSQAVDASGNIYLTGYFTNSTWTIGVTKIIRVGTQDAFVMKLDSSGNMLWVKNFGGSGALVYGNSIKLDPSNNIYIGGYLRNASLTTPTLNRIGTRDAFVMKLDSSSGNVLWAKNFGGSGASSAYGQSLAVDSSSNVYLGGYFTGANLTTPALTRFGTTDAFVIKLDSSGNVLWANNFGGSGAAATGQSVAVDSSFNVFILGYFGGNLTTPAVTKIGTQDAFVIKLDSSGNVLWAKNFGGSGAAAYGLRVAVDSSSNVYLSGYISGGNLTTPAVTKIGTQDTFVMKLDSSGNVLWAKNFGGSGATAFGSSVVVDSSSNVYFGAHFTGADLTTPALAKIGIQDAFAVKLDSSGNTTWSKNFGGSGATVYGYSVVVDSSSNVYLSGNFYAADLTTPALTKVGVYDPLLIRLDSSGNTTLAKEFGSTETTSPLIFAQKRASNGSVYLVGATNLWDTQCTIGGVTLTVIGIGDIIAAKLDSSGNVLWAKNFGGSNVTASGYNLAVDSSSNVYLTGYFYNGNLTTPALAIVGGLGANAFAIKLDSSGNTTWAKSYGGTGASAYGQSIAVDSSSNVYLGGYFSSANLTTPALTKIGTQDAFVIKLNSSGTTTWAKNFGGSGASTSGFSVNVDSGSSVYLGGYFSSANLTTPALTKIGTQDAFVIKLNSSGTTTWAKNFGGSGASTSGYGVNVDSSSNVYLGGDFSGADLTTPALTKIGTQDAFVIKLNSSGTTTWAKNFGGSGASAAAAGRSIVVDSSSNIYLGGDFSGADLTTPVLTKIGIQDSFAVKLDSSGNTTWSKNFGGSDVTFLFRALDADGNGNVYISGWFDGSDLTNPLLARVASRNGMILNTQLFHTACTTTGSFKFDSANNVMVFCDGSYWQSMNNNTSTNCPDTTIGKFKYYANGGSSDFVWYATGGCRSAKGSTTYGACTTHGNFVWSSSNNTYQGCINGTWTSLLGF